MLYFEGIKWLLIVHLLQNINLGYLFLLPLVIRDLKRRERGRRRIRIVISMNHYQPLQVMLEMIF